MTKKAKENEVSRRDFIKDLGGGAIGAAIISTEFLAPRPVDAAAASKITVRPHMTIKDLGDTRWEEIKKLTDKILNEFGPLGAKQTNWRLNQSDKPPTIEERRLPVFIYWVATNDITKTLLDKSGEKVDFGRRRLGDSLTSSVYDEGLDRVVRGIKDVVVRDWDCDRLLKEKKVDSQLLVPKAGLRHQRFIGIVVEQPEGKKQRRCGGLLTLSFEKTPSKPEDVDAKMKQWAAWPGYPKSELVNFIEKNFVLGGPQVV
jgi:hypothetical protein